MAEQVPPQIYYPRARVRLNVRFEDFSAPDTPTPPKKPPQLRAGTGDPELQIVVREGILILEAKGTGSGAQIGPSASQTTSTDKRTFDIDGIIPNSASLGRNGVRTADTLEFEVDFNDFPFDPRVIRSVGVEFYLGTITAEEHQRDLEGAVRMGGANDGAPVGAIPDTWIDARGRLRSNLRFQGWVDEMEATFDEEGEPTVRVSCTDYTRVLLDQLAPPKLTIAADKPLCRAIAEYLANFPQFRGLGVAYIPRGADQPVLSDVLAKSTYKPTLGPSPKGDSKLNVMDYLTDVCGAVGHICHIETTLLSDGSNIPTIVVQRPRTLYANKFSGRDDDPFTGRILPSGRELLARTFTYGENVLSFSVARKFARLAPSSVEVRCFSSKVKRTLVCRFPEEKKEREKKLAPGDQADQKWDVLYVHGIDDEDTLRVIAQGVYESTQRGEMTGHIATKNMASLGGGNPDPDILDILAGDQVELEITKNLDADNTVMSVEDALAARAAEFLREKGFSDGIAQAYGKAKANIHFPTSFRVRELNIDWSIEDGVSLEFEAVNYVDAVRDEKKLPAGVEQEPDDTSTNNDPERVEV